MGCHLPARGYTGSAISEDALSEACPERLLVFDVGGSHIAAGVFHPASLSLGSVKNLVSETAGSVDEFFAAFESLAGELLPSGFAAQGVAVAMPNPFDYKHGVSYMKHKYQQLYGIDVRRGLSERLRYTPDRIRFLNDAAAFLVGEIHQGAARGLTRAIGVTLGTGVGSAFAVNGKIVMSGQGVPQGGEIWNLPYLDNIVEDAISGHAIRALYQERTGSIAEVREIAELATQQEPARETFERFGRELGEILQHVCGEFSAERIVFGGGISHAAALFLPAAKREMAGFTTELCVSELFERAPLIGAGIGWLDAKPIASNQAEPVLEKRK
jgi:glucokinase